MSTGRSRGPSSRSSRSRHLGLFGSLGSSPRGASTAWALEGTRDRSRPERRACADRRARRDRRARGRSTEARERSERIDIVGFSMGAFVTAARDLGSDCERHHRGKGSAAPDDHKLASICLRCSRALTTFRRGNGNERNVELRSDFTTTRSVLRRVFRACLRGVLVASGRTRRSSRAHHAEVRRRRVESCRTPRPTGRRPLGAVQ